MGEKIKAIKVAVAFEVRDCYRAETAAIPWHQNSPAREITRNFNPEQNERHSTNAVITALYFGKINCSTSPQRIPMGFSWIARHNARRTVSPVNRQLHRSKRNGTKKMCIPTFLTRSAENKFMRFKIKFRVLFVCRVFHFTIHERRKPRFCRLVGPTQWRVWDELNFKMIF